MGLHRTKRGKVAIAKRSPVRAVGRLPARVPDELAGLLVRCRSEQDLSLEQVGVAIGITKKAVSNIERGLSVPRRTTRLRLENFLRERGYISKAA